MKLYTWTNAAFIAALAFAGSPAFADNCTGEFKNMMAAGDALPSSGGQKVSWFTLTPDVTSPDTGYNGSGQCVGYVREMPDGKALVSNTCILATAEGDVWGFTGMQEGGSNKGKWVTTHGTGKFAKNAGSSGWYENVTADEKGSVGKWGGNCVN